MPGFTLLTGRRRAERLPILRAAVARFSVSLQPCSSSECWSSDTTVGLYVSHDAYPPVSRIVGGGCEVLIEGSLSLHDHDVLELAARLRDGPGAARIEGLRGLRDADGEFVLVVRALDDERTWVVTDRYGHLPLYRADLEGGSVLTRDFAIACDLAEKQASADPEEVAAYLIFNFVPGRGTIHPAVRAVPPGALLTLVDGGVEEEFWDHWERTLWPASSQPAGPREVVDAIVGTCRWRLSRGETTSVVSLSGGLDSRAVVAALRRSWSHPLPAATFSNPHVPSVDVPFARRVARAADMPWNLEELTPIGIEEQDELFEIKRGLNSLRMAFLLPFFHALLRRYGTGMKYFTGDTGLLARSLLPRRPIRSVDDFFARLFVGGGYFHRHAACSVAQGCEAARISERRFQEWLAEIAAELDPEGDWERRFLTFVVDGYGRRWHYEGMDRNRYYFGLETPLESTVVVNLLQRVPDRRKRHLAFLGAVIRELDRELGSIPKAGQRFPPGSRAQNLTNRLGWLRLMLASRVSGRRRSAPAPGPAAARWLAQARQVWESSPAAQAAFDLEACEEPGASEQAAATALSLARFWARLEGKG